MGHLLSSILLKLGIPATRFLAAAAFSVEAAKGIFLRSAINRSTDLHAAHAALRLTSADFSPYFNSISRNTRHGYRSRGERRSPLIFISAQRCSQAALETACMTKSNAQAEKKNTRENHRLRFNKNAADERALRGKPPQVH